MRAWMLCVGLLACTSEPAAEPAASDERSARSRWEAVRAPDNATLLTTLARVVGVGAGRGADVAAAFDGRVRRLLVAPGDTVAQGDALAEIFSPELSVAAADVLGAQSEERILQTRGSRLETLVSEGLARTDDVLDNQRALVAARARRQRAEAKLRSAEIGRASVRAVARRGFVILHSPIDGVVHAIEGRIGSFVGPDEPLIRIAGSGAVRISTRTTAILPPGRRVLRTDDADLTLTRIGEATRDPDDGLWVTYFEPERQSALRHGEQWPLIVDAGDTDLVEVPASALIGLRGREARVLRRRGTETQRINVRVERVDGARALVQGELAPNDEVAVDPALLTVEGDA